MGLYLELTTSCCGGSATENFMKTLPVGKVFGVNEVFRSLRVKLSIFAESRYANITDHRPTGTPQTLYSAIVTSHGLINLGDHSHF